MLLPKAMLSYTLRLDWTIWVALIVTVSRTLLMLQAVSDPMIITFDMVVVPVNVGLVVIAVDGMEVRLAPDPENNVPANVPALTIFVVPVMLFDPMLITPAIVPPVL